MRARALLVCFLWAGCCWAEATKPPINLYGEWVCYRYFDGEEEFGGSIEAKQAIGEKIDFEKDYIQFSGSNRRKFYLYPDGIVKNVTYEWKIEDVDGDARKSDLQMDFNGPLKEESSPFAYALIARSVLDRFVIAFELSRRGELTYYLNGQVFFYKKVSTSEGKEMGSGGGFWDWLKGSSKK